MSVDELRQGRPGLRSRTSPTRVRCLGGEEAVIGHPLVVENLAEVAAAPVGQQHNDDIVRRGGLGDAERGDDGDATGTAGQQRFLAGQASRHQERVGVTDRDDLVADALVIGLWRCPRRHPRRGRGDPSRRSRPILGVRTDDLDATVQGFLEGSPHAPDGCRPGADAQATKSMMVASVCVGISGPVDR